MKTKHIMKQLKSAWLLLALVAMNACMEPDIREVLLEKEFYKTTYDADAAVMGVYSKFMELADEVVILNELRADLMDVTENATPDMLALSTHQVKSSNAYCDASAFYEVILNCNEALEKFDKMREDLILDEDNYSERYADVMAVRCWTYLQLGIHYGQVKYVDKPINSAKEAQDSTLFPTYDLDALLPVLISEMENLPTMDDYFVVDLATNLEEGAQKKMLFINKYFLLGDLYLWSNQYEKAATQYYTLMNKYNSNSYKYKTTAGVWQTNSTPVGFWIRFLRYNDGNISQFRNKWKEMFALETTSSELDNEMIWVMSYDYRYDPEYPFIKLFANTGSGKYQLKPSAYAIDSLWENQQQDGAGLAFDGRGREASFDWVNGQPVIIKYLYDYYSQTVDATNSTIHLQYDNVEDLYRLEGRWFLYRAALLHLRYAEAVNRAGYPKLAMAFLNGGLQETFNDSRSNKTGCQYTGWPVYTTNAAGTVIIDQTKDYEPYPEPYYFDARNVDAAYGAYRGPWTNHLGLRSRAYLKSLSEPQWAKNYRRDTLVWQAATTHEDTLALEQVIHMDSVRWIEDYLVQEAALELGFEGHRWGDLLRVSRRRMADGLDAHTEENSPANLLNRQVQRKHREAGSSAPELTEANWYLPMQ